MNFKLSLDYSSYPIQYKCYVCSCKYNINTHTWLPVHGKFKFCFLDLSGVIFPNVFDLRLVDRGYGAHGYRELLPHCL